MSFHYSCDVFLFLLDIPNILMVQDSTGIKFISPLAFDTCSQDFVFLV